MWYGLMMPPYKAKQAAASQTGGNNEQTKNPTACRFDIRD